MCVCVCVGACVRVSVYKCRLGHSIVCVCVFDRPTASLLGPLRHHLIKIPQKGCDCGTPVSTDHHTCPLGFIYACAQHNACSQFGPTPYSHLHVKDAM